MKLIQQNRVSNTRIRGIVAALLLLASDFLVASAVHAQAITRAVPFVLSARDTTPTEYLPQIEPGPAGKHGAWHLTADGHYQASDGTSMRFVGTELQWNAVFQPSENARILAGRLAKLGFNAVRFNNWDYWGYDDYSFFSTYDDKGKVQNTSYAINPLQLARFDTLLYELKRAGIYVFLPLHAYHRYRPEDGVPTWDSTYSNTFLMPILYKEAAAKEQQFAHWLSAHVNPLTGIALGQDPQIACWEIAQEFTIPFYWYLGRLNYIDSANVLTRGMYTISYHQSRHLDTLFNDFLKKKYGTDGALDAAWRGAATVDQHNLLDNGSFESYDLNRWTLNNVAPARSTSVIVSPGQDNSPAVMIHISGLDTTGIYYGNIFTNASAVLGKDSLYEYSFWAKLRIDPQHPVSSRTIYAYVSAPGLGTNLATEFAIDTTWRRYTFNFRCAYGGGQSTGVLFSGAYGDVVLDNFSIRRMPEIGLQPGESLSGIRIKRLAYADMKSVSAARAHDLVDFYQTLERTYFDGMQRTLRDTLHVAGLINRSQTNYWGNVLDFDDLKDGEVTSVHTGWDYVGARPNTVYSDSTWMIRNYSLTKDAGMSALALAAAGSVVGKAHTLSWTVPNNNQTSSENALIPFVYASLQDWDGIFFSPYAVRRDEVLADSIIPGYPTYAWTDIAANHTFMALLPAASYAYRTHQIRTSSILDTMHHDPNDVFLYPHYPDYRGVFGLEGFQGGDQGIVTYLKVRQKFNSRHQLAAENYYTPGDSLNRSETEEISYAPMMRYFRVQTPTVYGYTGFPAGDIEFPMLRVRRTDNSGDILSFYYVIDSAKHSALLSVGTRTQNSGVRWVDTLGYGKNTGHAPTIMSAAKLELSISSDAKALNIQPLDSTGNPFGSAIAASRSADGGSFTATIDQKVPPATWFYIQEEPTNDVMVSSSTDADVHLLANPVRDHVSLAATQPIFRVSIVDELGRVVASTIFDSDRATLGVGELATGTYTAMVQLSGGTTVRKRLTVLR